MSELLPTVQAHRIRRSITDYLTTTFALADQDVREVLDTFLRHPVDGMFKGPYIRIRLPFRPADPGLPPALEWYAGPPPYGHQAAAFARLSTWNPDGTTRRAKPTLVTTGTGSGKTEAFLYPILDHIRRARRNGVTGTKALILYPMNALANDQASRLARLITGHPGLADVTAALYTGQDGPPRDRVTVDGLITDRDIIRDDPPDILLTNYKMLDQLLLRCDDRKIWAASATSLRYLVLDEFHTYDGAQGTDVAMLLRRLGLTLKSHWPVDGPDITDADRRRPLGLMVPVATSATLGDKGDPATMLEFAHTVFGERFGPDAVVTETRIPLDEWLATDTECAGGPMPLSIDDIDVAAIAQAVRADDDPAGPDLTRAVLPHLFAGGPAARAGLDVPEPRESLGLAKSSPLVAAIAAATTDAIPLDDLTGTVGGRGAVERPEIWREVVSAVVAVLGHLRGRVGRDAASVETHLWVRELTRIDREASSTPRFRWADDGPPSVLDAEEVVRPGFPAVYCRHCGRSGWGVALAPVGAGLAADDTDIRRLHLLRQGRFRALLSAPREGAAAAVENDTAHPGLVWWHVTRRELLTGRPDDDDPDVRHGHVLPVLTTTGPRADDHARDDHCPSCGTPDGIRFLGSAIATLLSVSLSALFGSGTLDAREKKALVFTDSVQDAAHRAGFVQARSHTLTLRGVLRTALAEDPITLDELLDAVLRRAGDDPFARYRLLHPDCADREGFMPFWKARRQLAAKPEVRERVRLRLALDVALEFGLNSRTGRTLELTGSASAGVDAGSRERMAVIARTAINSAGFTATLESETGPDDTALVRWVRGVLERMRTRGAIEHRWFERYRDEDGNRWSISGGRPRAEGMPAFPPGRPAPGYPRVGGSAATRSDTSLDPVTGAQSWYARWTTKALGVSPGDGAVLVRALLDRLQRDGILSTRTSPTGAVTYALPAARVLVQITDPDTAAAGRYELRCDTCRTPTPGSPDTLDQLLDGPCLVDRCAGRLRIPPTVTDGDFYRRLYASADARRIVAREHTSLLEDAVRLEYENGFKRSGGDPQAPNVLVATPTLEMGIDIGDLSTVFLGSLPRTVASYLQRIGRAGRLTGNALDLAFVTGRGEHLPKLGEPLSVINGEVRPPATYLQAEEILRRQFTAHLIDRIAREGTRRQPRKSVQALGSTEPNSFLGAVIGLAESDPHGHVSRFADAFDVLPTAIHDSLVDWTRAGHGPGSSRFADDLRTASALWRATVAELEARAVAVEGLIPSLEAAVESPAVTEDDRFALRSARSALKLTRGRLAGLNGEYWIGVLEQYGVLPNYTLLDDRVTLDVGLSWTDPDSRQTHHEHTQLQRGSAQAIRDFAPGNRFYARGLEIAIDAVDLGVDGVAVQRRRYCPRCGYSDAVLPAGMAPPAGPACPRCGSVGLGDSGQLLDTVQLSHVTAEVRRDEAGVSDRSDQRYQRSFEIVCAADIDDTHVGRSWYAQDVGLHCRYLRRVDLQWVNLGPRGGGATRDLAGGRITGPLFRVCAGCGKLDLDAGVNLPHEHRAWCRYRTDPDEHTVEVALTRTLRTQGLLLDLPPTITVGDLFAVPSLTAAVLLGMRELLGGHPDHLQVEHIHSPAGGQGLTREALLLHDVVPGGTGYLAGLAEPDRLRDVLTAAWHVVRDCPCQVEQRLACHRCLLPFAPTRQLNVVSRAAAERHLRTLLDVSDTAGAETDPGGWRLAEHPDTDPADSAESYLEQRFRAAFVARLRAMSASVTETPGPWGNTVQATIPGSAAQWRLVPQVNLLNSRPDFVLQSTDTGVPTVAIFVDGAAHHASPSANRLADDAGKRTLLREAGHVVLSVTAVDVDAVEAGGSPDAAWYDASVRPAVVTRFPATQRAYDEARRPPIDWLAGWMRDPEVDQRRLAARGLPLFMMRPSTAMSVAAGVTAEAIGLDVLDRTPPPEGPRRIQVRHEGPLVSVVEPDAQGRMVVTILLDDRPAALTGDGYRAAWRTWLARANALALRDWPTTVTVASLIGAAASAVPEPDVVEQIPEPWRAAWSAAGTDAERALLRVLSGRPGIPVPEVGPEGPEGIPLDIAWPNLRVTVAINDLADADRQDLESAGWQVLVPDPDTVVAALAAATEPEGD